MHTFSMNGRKMRSIVREDSMRGPAALFSIAFAIGAIVLAPGAVAREPTVITACQTIDRPGAYVLANTIEMGGFGTCLTITASRVTIDLDGFTVAGRTHAIQGNAQGITVKNGSVFSRDAEAVFLLGEGSKVTGLHVTTNFLGSGISANGIVRGNVVIGVIGTGIGASGTVTDNYVKGNGVSFDGEASAVGISASGTVRGNTATNNLIGIEVSAGSEVIDNTAADNTKIGIQAECPSNLIDNTAVNNGTNLVLIGQGCQNKHNVAP
jgi:parallel beta-helix repeat protein